MDDSFTSLRIINRHSVVTTPLAYHWRFFKGLKEIFEYLTVRHDRSRSPGQAEMDDFVC